MKIRTQFIISTVTLALFLLLISVSVIVTNQKVKKIHQQGILSTQIERGAYELGYLANDYLLYREGQQASRWESKFTSFSNDVSNLELNTPEQQALLANIKTNQQRLKAIFEEVWADIESTPQTQEAGLDTKFMQVSWSRLEVQNQGIIFEASRLTQMLSDQEDQLRRVTSLLSFVLIGLLGAYLFGVYGLILRRTLSAIAELQAGARVIGSGDLDFSIPVKNKDEIGELSHAFNRMTSNLKQVTASKADLEKEIIEREQVQQALGESEMRITSLYATMTEGLANHEVVYEAGEAIDYIITDVNPAYEQITGLLRNEVVGRRASELYCIGKPPYLDIYARVAASGVPEDFETYFPPMEKHFAISISSPGKGKFATVFSDITARKRAEVELVRLASFPEKNPNPIVELDYSGTIIYLNPKSRMLFPDLVNSGFRHPLLSGLELLIKKFRAGELETPFIQVVRAGEVYFHQTIVNLPENEHIRLYHVDITQRKQAEETLALQAEDLQRSNAELEQFAYVASHDLQEPLRIMANFSQLLERRYKGRLDQDADEFIGFIVDAATRMQKMITDLLAYSRAGRGDTHMVEVDCDRLVRKLVESMALTIESADAQVTFDRLPVVTAHEASMIQLFQNLISNALKFRSEQPPRIHISAKQADGEWVFSVRDNGIGLEPQYNQRIFMIFQRLHPRDKYAGTGIGLSICKKIVENMGGRIWVESEPGRGSTFTFTVPVNANIKGVKND